MADPEQLAANVAAVTDREVQLRELAHDLRNHLYAIGLSAAVLRKKGPDRASFDELLACIANEHKQAVVVLDEILKLAQSS